MPTRAGGLLQDVRGLRVGHFTSTRRATGCSVVLCDSTLGPLAPAGVSVRGAAPASRETELLRPMATMPAVHALLLTGGSAFGLAAADGVMAWLERRGIGVGVGAARVPLVPAAALFDLWHGDLAVRPDAAAGEAACDAAVADAAQPQRGRIGAGAGASVGKLFGLDRAMPGGLGQASIALPWQGRTVTLAAMAAVNPLGDVVDPATGRILAGSRGDDGAPRDTMACLRRGEMPASLRPPATPTPSGAATTLVIVGTDLALDKTACNRLADVAHDGLARAIRPVHTAMDGDTVFAVATGHAGVAPDGSGMDFTVLGALAADVVAEAIVDAVRATAAAARD